MKTYLSIIAGLLFATVASAGTVSLNVKVEGEKKPVDRSSKDQKKLAEVTRTQWLSIRVTNSSGTKLDGVTLKWVLFASNLRRGSDSTVIEKSGEMKITVDANGRYADVATPKVAFVYTPTHTETSGSGRRSRAKEVEETGHKYRGYYVQVISGDSVLGEAISQEDLRKAMK
jgi:hypothetical protein